MRNQAVVQTDDACEERMTMWDTDGTLLASVEQVACLQPMEKMSSKKSRAPAKL